MTQFSENLKNARKAKNMTQLDLASKLFVTKQAVSKWESGKGYPDPETFPVISEVLEISIDELMGKIMDKVENKKINLEKAKFKKRFIIQVTFLGIFILTSLILILFFTSRSYQGYRKINKIESAVNVYLPVRGKLETYDYNTWSKYDAFITISEMGYIVFTKEKEITLFEEDLKTNMHWIDFASNLDEIIPYQASIYTSVCDYYMVYNTDLNEYNQLPSKSGNYNYIFLCYQKENNRLIYFKYQMPFYRGGE
ncbi:MAG: helix-turn-helix domain-containing protein [Crenarchaeota archaeon]|nr:helix-turn-helix domain-containing protein [Thermoproteota archaeon]